MRRLLSSVVAVELEHLATAAVPPTPAGGGVHTDTFLVLAAVLCFLLCVVGLALVARCSRLCNPSAFAVEAQPSAGAGAAAMPAATACKGMERTALQSLPTVSFHGGGGKEDEEEEEERPECAICLAEFARRDEVRVLPPCGHGFHAACVDVWLLSSSSCPSCRRALVVAAPPCCTPADAAQASSPPSQADATAGGCHMSVP